MTVQKRSRRRGGESKSVQVTMSCSGCEPLLSAQLQAVKDELQADTSRQLDDLQKRVCENYFLSFVLF